MTPEDFSSLADDENIKVIGLGSWRNLMGLSSSITRDELNKKILKWCNAHKVLYYCRPNRSFNLVEAVKWAKTAEVKTLLVENLG